MNIAKYSLDNPKVIYFFLFVMLIGGVISFGSLGKKEDSPFVIKTAVLITQYPGASPKEVEQLITEPIEREIQSMRRVYKIKSDSYYGMSKINIELSPATPPEEMPQMWDELRRKVLNVQSQLPQGASDIKVSDDFGDVFGIYFSLTADEGFSYHDLREWGQRLKTELVTIEGVQKVALFGEQTEVVNVFISMSKLANSGINLNSLMQTIKSQNSLINTGEKRAGNIQLKILAEGTYKNLTDIRNQLIFPGIIQLYTVAIYLDFFSGQSVCHHQGKGSIRIIFCWDTICIKQPDILTPGQLIQVLNLHFLKQLLNFH